MPDWILTDDLKVEHLQSCPVWEYVNDEAVAPDRAVRPIHDSRVTSLNGRIVGVQVTLQNQSQRWAILGNVSLWNVRVTKHFLFIWIERDRQWFNLARYHDADFDRRSPAQLAHYLGLTVPDVFPIHYDISHVALGVDSVIRGVISADPDERLSQSQLLELALSDGD